MDLCWARIWVRGRYYYVQYIRKALYGLKALGAAFQAHLTAMLHDIGFKPTKADPDVWLRPATKPDGFEYYEYALSYVDDIMSVSHQAGDVLCAVQNVFKLKDNKIAQPKTYLAVQLSKMLVDRLEGWVMSSEQYMKSSLENIKNNLKASGRGLRTKCRTPLVSGYHPEEGMSAELRADGLQKYQELIRILHWQ